MDGVAPVDLIVTDLGWAEGLGASFGDESWLGHLDVAAAMSASGTGPAPGAPKLARQIAGPTVVDIDHPSRDAADGSSGREE